MENQENDCFDEEHQASLCVEETRKELHLVKQLLVDAQKKYSHMQTIVNGRCVNELSSRVRCLNSRLQRLTEEMWAIIEKNTL